MTAPPCRVRPARAGEAALVADLAARTFRDAYGPQNRPEDLALHLTRHCSEAVLRGQIEDPACSTLLAEVDGRLVGFVQLSDLPPPVGVPAPGSRCLARCYVEQGWIGRGIGPALMDAAKEEARRRGARRLWLTVWQQAPRPIAFYRRHGFEAVGTTTFLVGDDPQADWVMSCPL